MTRPPTSPLHYTLRRRARRLVVHETKAAHWRLGHCKALRNGPQRLVEQRPHGGVARDSASVGEFARVCVGGVVVELMYIYIYRSEPRSLSARVTSVKIEEMNST